MTIRQTFFYTFVFICALLAFSLYLQADGYTPCPLCLMQRYTLVALAVIFFLAAAMDLRKYAILGFSLLATIGSILGMVLSARQVWLQHSPNSHVDCGASLQYMLQVLPLTRVLKEVFAGSAECTLRGWQFLSLSLAEWSLICFSLLILISLVQIYRGLRA